MNLIKSSKKECWKRRTSLGKNIDLWSSMYARCVNASHLHQLTAFELARSIPFLLQFHVASSSFNKKHACSLICKTSCHQICLSTRSPLIPYAYKSLWIHVTKKALTILPLLKGKGHDLGPPCIFLIHPLIKDVFAKLISFFLFWFGWTNLQVYLSIGIDHTC